jgi:type I restriction-modification system DNA methylase subunit
MSDETAAISIPFRRMTQAELDAFLEKAADLLRGNVDHSEFRGYVFALLFFKRISDIFEEAVRNLAKTLGDELANDPAMQKKSLPFVVPADSVWEEVTLANTSAGNFNLGARALGQFTLPLPTLEEQDAIIKAIDAADDQVIAVDEQLTAARRVKQSLLQNLLTGKIRLKP